MTATQTRTNFVHRINTRRDAITLHGTSSLLLSLLLYPPQYFEFTRYLVVKVSMTMCWPDVAHCRGRRSRENKIGTLDGGRSQCGNRFWFSPKPQGIEPCHGWTCDWRMLHTIGVPLELLIGFFNIELRGLFILIPFIRNTSIQGLRRF